MARSAPKTQQAALSLSVQYAVEAEGVPTRPRFRRWVQAALEGDAEITLRLVDEEEGRALNRDYRGKDYATNVLTFVYDDLPYVAGDIVICPAVVAREAREQGKALDAHYAHLTVHGVLHLQGYDHENDAEAEEMERRETQIVTKLGYSDPYRVINNE
jgi:probable rRNA maturation factor